MFLGVDVNLIATPNTEFSLSGLSIRRLSRVTTQSYGYVPDSPPQDQATA
jgi:hypothetical protein